MLLVILFIITTYFPLYSCEAAQDLLSEDDRQCIRRLSLQYQESLETETLVKLRQDPQLWKLLKKHKICKLKCTDSERDLAWVTTQIGTLKEQLTVINEEMMRYEGVVTLCNRAGNKLKDPSIKEQIAAINRENRLTKRAPENVEDPAELIITREKLRTLKYWREALNVKRRVQNLISHLETFYQEQKADSLPSASAITRYILRSPPEELTDNLQTCFKSNLAKTRIMVKQFCEEISVVAG